MIALLANQPSDKILSFFILLVKGRVLIPDSAFPCLWLMFLPALQTLQPLWEFWRPQHIGVGQFVDYPVAAEGYVHYVVCCYNPLKKHRFSSSPRDIQIQ